MKKIGQKLIAEKKAEATIKIKEETSSKEKDLLSLLIRANMATDMPANQRMSDAVMLARMYTQIPRLLYY
jgi:hypothetical protein